MQQGKFRDTVAIFFAVRWFHIKEYWHSVFHYYTNLRFACQDTLLLLFYFFESPYRISRRFFETTGQESVYPYGETPFRTLETIAKAVPITVDDAVYDLGCGRGRGCFWFASTVQCRVVGIDCNQKFIVRAQRVQQILPSARLAFKQENILHCNLEDATVVYLYCLTLSDSDTIALGKKLATLPKKPFIVTVSFALNEYLPGTFLLLKSFDVVFAWGTTACYIQRPL